VGACPVNDGVDFYPGVIVGALVDPVFVVVVELEQGVVLGR
jgi:hypothetical protein